MLNFIRDIHTFFWEIFYNFCGRLRMYAADKIMITNRERIQRNENEQNENRNRANHDDVACIVAFSFVYSSDTIYLETECTMPGEGIEPSDL